MPIVIVATIRPLPEHRETVGASLQRAVPRAHEEVGCELYALHTSANDEYVLVEQWSDERSLQLHVDGQSFRSLMAELDGKLSEPLDLQTLQPIPVGTSMQGRLRLSG